jgi:hypothetical protein
MLRHLLAVRAEGARRTKLGQQRRASASNRGGAATTARSSWKGRGKAVGRPNESASTSSGKEEEELKSSSEDVYISACDYGFHDNSGVYDERGTTTPSNVFDLAVKNFKQEWAALQKSIAERSDYEEMTDSGWADTPSANDDLYGSVMDEDLCFNFQDELKKLTLDDEKVYQRELKRQKDPNYFAKKSWIVKGPYIVLCWLLDRVYSKERPIQRFWFLETVARMPYFSYISMLHLYETLGWWRRGAGVKKVHFAEEWNEFHHLLIMESLGGDEAWIDRFAGYHAAVIYYWVLDLLWMISPFLAYQFSELLESHAVDTYSEFVEENEALLKSLPAPAIARQYYQNEDLYMFDEFQTAQTTSNKRRPEINTLFDTFSNIRDDELEHVKTMVACQNSKYAVRSPHDHQR